MKTLFSVFIAFLLPFYALIAQEKLPTYKNSEATPNERVEDLLERMSLNEKVGQLIQYHVPETPPDLEELKKDIRAGKVSSMVNNVTQFYPLQTRNLLQKIAVEESRLGIPLIFSHDVIHGCKTILPVSLAQSCTWDPALVEEGAEMSAREAKALGINWINAPMVDVSRDPRWGRIVESYGEDTYLNSVFGAAMVRGYQGHDQANKYRLAACAKHFVGYGAAMGGRDYQFTPLSERALRETYLPPFKACIDAGVLTVMTAFNDIDGVPATGNEFVLTKILREEWGFEGMVVSDWDAVEQLIYHGYAKDSLDAAIKAIQAGTDLEMKSRTYELLIDAVKNGKIDEDVIDLAVSRVLRVKFTIGLFDSPLVDEERAEKDILQNESLELARKIARESMVLLENKNNVLPIDKRYKNICITGPFADEDKLMGWWQSLGDTNDVITPFSGLNENAPTSLKLTREITAETEAAIVCVGERFDQFSEAHSRSDIKLPFNQDSFIDSLAEYDIPVIVVVFNGRPLDLSNVKLKADAILLAWHPGTQAGNALADVIYGNYNPSGKLTTSFPNSVGQIPVYYNHRNSGRPASDGYIDNSSEPLYPFGYGLSYTEFQYSKIKVTPEKARIGEKITVSTIIMNVGNRPGKETVQLYIHDVVGSLTQPVKLLKQFKSVMLEPGQSKEVSFTLGPKDLEILNHKMEWTVEPGEFSVWIGKNAKDGLHSFFEITNK